MLIASQQTSERQETMNGFTIGPEENGYEMFKNDQTYKFSAGRVDNDQLVNQACVELHSGGWWYDQCGDWNLNGRLTLEPGLNPKDAFFNGDKVYSSSIMISRPEKNVEEDN